MAVDVASSRPFRVRHRALARARASSAGLALAGMVATSFALRFGAALRHTTPFLFPDEYIYSELGRSIAHGHLSIRGQTSHFPALLEPLVIATFWLRGDVETVFRMTQAFNALAASLVAVPVFLLARKLALKRWQQLACAVSALVLPSLVYSSYATADMLGMTLAACAVYVGVSALDRPTRRNQVLFVVVAGLATLARVQYVVLFVAFAVGVLAVEGKSLRALGRYRVAGALVTAPLVAALALGPSRSLGYYHDVLDFHVGIAFWRWLATDAMFLVYASGFVLVPLAVTGMTAGLLRPRSRIERGFAALMAAATVLLLVEASLYAANGSDRFQERYLVLLPPLVPVLFCFALSRRPARAERIASGVVAVGFVLVAARVPVSGYTRGFSSLDSPLLQAALKLESLTSTGTGSLLVAIAVLVLAPVAALAPSRRRVGLVAVAASMVVLAAASAAATAVDFQSSKAARQLLAADPSWVDHSGDRGVSVLVTPSTFRPVVSAHLFWNRSITHVLQMGSADDAVDTFGYAQTSVRRDGTLLADGKPVSGPLLVEEYGDSATLANARLVRRTIGASLWQSTGDFRLKMLTRGQYLDGWLALPASTVTVWPDGARARQGLLCFSLSLPADAVTTEIRFKGPGVDTRVAMAPAEQRTVGIPVHAATGPWTLSITGTHVFVLGGTRIVSVHAERPKLLQNPANGAQVRASDCR